MRRFAGHHVGMSDHAEWPLGPVLERERTERGMATREAARRAGISDTMWRNLERGYEIRKGVRFPITPKPETVAKAARAVGLSVDVVFPMVGIEIALARDFQHEPVDLSAVPDEQLLEEVRRRMLRGSTRTGEEIAEEAAAGTGNVTPIGEETPSPKQHRKSL